MISAIRIYLTHINKMDHSFRRFCVWIIFLIALIFIRCEWGLSVVFQSVYRVCGMSTRDVSGVIKLAPGARITTHKNYSTAAAAPSWISNGTE